MLDVRKLFRERRVITRIGSFVAAPAILLLAYLSIHAQSTQQDFPTPITSNQISGEIAARRIGDSRTTTYFYRFKGDTGDTFINVLTENFAGDIDVVVADGLRLISRMVILADTEPSETGRVIYLRKPETLLLRINGRSPNDDPAKFRMKFAGSFVAINAAEAAPVPELPEVPKPVFTDSVAAGRDPDNEDRVSPDRTASVVERKETEPEVEAKPVDGAKNKTESKTAGKQSPVITKSQDRPVSKTRQSGTASRTTRTAPPAVSETDKTPTEATKTEKPAEADPMTQFRLVIVFKDGSRIERPMVEVLRFTVDRAILTVIGKDGRIGRYSMAEVQRVGIE